MQRNGDKETRLNFEFRKAESENKKSLPYYDIRKPAKKFRVVDSAWRNEGTLYLKTRPPTAD